MSYTTPYYDKYRKWIKEARANDYNWDKIKYGLGKTDVELNTFLTEQKKHNFWDIDDYDWKNIVIQEENAEIYSIDADIYDSTQVISSSSNVDLVEPMPEDSCWQQYAKKLRVKGFMDDSINSIRESTLKILKNLKLTTTPDNPIKGMVMGNVQSGKTANMAALMSMAADYGWNFFIVLSGTIENLRVQTQDRLIKDLAFPTGNLIFQGLNDLKPYTNSTNSPSNLHLDDNSRIRYLYVCLKNATRLSNLLQWINKDQPKKNNMRILLIDDEADQAGINTADVNDEERKRINQLIINLVFSKNHKNINTVKSYKSMNYIGYTATPYANLLNETVDESLYPHSFIAVLGVSKEYFGPQQIFGIEGSDDYIGLEIINEIANENDKSEIEKIIKIHRGISSQIPISLMKSIAWFLTSVAALRFLKYKGSLSMLIHTSQKQSHHENIYIAIQNWFGTFDQRDLYQLCQKVWHEQTNMLTFEKFFNQYPKYGNLDVKDYPHFCDIENELRFLVESNPVNIQFDSSLELIYSDEVHLCIDNCKYSGINDEGMHLRLRYPDETNMPKSAPAFIVVGGSTLSRGLTIEGLVSTYFLRPVGQADTLMQMGRWFGYRRGYELYPRLWLTENTVNQFKFLSKLDSELRKEIYMMEQRDISPSDYAVKILNTPRLRFINITSKNKMQGVELAEVDYSGFINHVTNFYGAKNILESNLNYTIEFIKKLGDPRNNSSNLNPHSNDCFVWSSISNDDILDFVKYLKYPNQPDVFLEIDHLEQWLYEMAAKNNLKSWNVVLAGTKRGKNFHIGKLNLNLVSRSKKKTSTEDVIKLGVLRNPSDLLSDIYNEDNDSELYQLLLKGSTKLTDKIRKLAGLDKVPLLIVYIIDKDSKASLSDANKNRIDLDAECNLSGIYIQIPGGEKGKNHITKVQAKLVMDFNKGDIE